MTSDPWDVPIYLRAGDAAPLDAGAGDLDAAVRLELDALRRRGLPRPTDLLQHLFVHDGRCWRLSACRAGVLAAPASSEEAAPDAPGIA